MYVCIYLIYVIPDLSNFPAFPQAAEAQSLLPFYRFARVEWKKILKLMTFSHENWWLKGDVTRISFWGNLGQFLQKGVKLLALGRITSWN